MQTVKTDQYDVRIESVLEHGLEQPRSLSIVNTDLLIGDRKGLRTYSNGVLSEPVRGLPALDGLEEIAPHRAGNADWLYITYVCSAECGHEGRHRYTLARGRIRAGEWTDHQVLHEYGDGDHVYGVSKLAFDDKGFVYVTLSAAEHPGQDTEDFEAELGKAQDLDSHRGKILRLHDDGRVPRDNPFAGKPGALSTIWSYGHRGLSGIGYDVATQSLWATEHGPWGGDELNRIVRGGNYGWPLVSFGYHYAGKPMGAAQAPGMESPVFHWTPSVGVSAVQVYDGAAFANWRGSVLVGSLGARIGRTLYRFQLEDNRARLYQYPTDARNRVLRDEKGAAKPRVPRYEEIAPDVGRIRDVRIGAEGYIYLLLESPDRIVRLVPLPRSPGAPRQQ
jgi:glucose/arabinose dehydrogenase